VGAAGGNREDLVATAHGQHGLAMKVPLDRSAILEIMESNTLCEVRTFGWW
jgi:hypothetical protein